MPVELTTTAVELQRETVQGKPESAGCPSTRAACRNPQPQVEGECYALRTQGASKSSGETWSRNSRNFSTSSSCSAGTARPASSSTSSAHTIRVPVRSASAIESEGRALTSAPAVEDQLGEEDAVLHVGDPHLVEPLAGGLEHVLHQVVGQRPRRDDALLGEGDRGGLDRPDPDRQVALPRHLAQQHDRLVGGHLDPDSDDVDFAHAPTLLRCPDRRPGAGQPRSSPAFTSVACRRTDSAAISRRGSSARPRAAASRPRGERRDDLLDQADLAVGGGLEGAQVARLEAEVGELARGLRDHEGVAVVVAGAGARRDQAVLLELGEQLLGDVGDLEQLAAREPQVARAPERLRARQPVGASARPWARWARPPRSPAARARGRWRRGARRSPCSGR